MSGITSIEKKANIVRIGHIVSDPRVKSFCIGRASDLERIKQKKGYDQIIPLTYYLKCEDAEEYVQELKELFRNFPNFIDESHDIREDKQQGVYLALKFQ